MSENRKLSSRHAKWEYMSCTQDPAEEQDEFLMNLNELGAEGWEAFGAVQEAAQKAAALTVFLKRQMGGRR